MDADKDKIMMLGVGRKDRYVLEHVSKFKCLGFGLGDLRNRIVHERKE